MLNRHLQLRNVVVECLWPTGIDTASSYMRQGEQLIRNFGHVVWCTGSLLFGGDEKSKG